MMGELVYDDFHKTTCKWEPEWMEFAIPKGDDKAISQIVISENMATCSLGAMARSPVGLIQVNTARLNKMFEIFPNLPRFEMTSTSMGKIMPIFNKIGNGVPLHLFMTFKNVHV